MSSILPLFPDNMVVSERGRINLSGFDILELAEKYSTPLYIYDAHTIFHNIDTLKDTLKKYYPGESIITYAAKAYFSLRFAQFIAKTEVGIDAVSENELIFALRAGIKPERIHLHGNNKTYAELDHAVQANIHAIVIDNFEDIEILERLSHKKSPISVWIRVNPEIDEIATHPYRNTGHSVSKFGLTIRDGQAETAIRMLMANPTFRLIGIHTHIGSQIFDTAPYKQAIREMLKLARRCNWTPAEVCPGGGWGVPYRHDEMINNNIENWIREISIVIQEEYRGSNFLPRLIIEPGRWIVARAGIAIYTVGRVKQFSNGEKLLAVDGGMGDNIRPPLYQAEYEAVVAENPLGSPTTCYRIVGRFCESGDELIHEIDLPEVQTGNHLIFPVSGAYHLSMASNYNLFARPAVLWVENGSVNVLQERENLFTGWWV